MNTQPVMMIANSVEHCCQVTASDNVSRPSQSQAGTVVPRHRPCRPMTAVTDADHPALDHDPADGLHNTDKASAVVVTTESTVQLESGADACGVLTTEDVEDGQDKSPCTAASGTVDPAENGTPLSSLGGHAALNSRRCF